MKVQWTQEGKVTSIVTHLTGPVNLLLISDFKKKKNCDDKFIN